MPTPAIPDSTEHIFVGLMTNHNGTTGSVTGINFDCTTYDYQVELKNRDNTESWWVTDSLMDGESGNWFPWDDATAALQTGASLISSVTSTSMTFGAALAADDYIVIIRKAGLQAGRGTVAESGTGDGSVNAVTYSANQTSGFSIIQATGHGGGNISAGQHTLAAHGLGTTIDIYQMFNQTTAAGRPVMPGHAYPAPASFSTDNYLLMDSDAGKSGALNVMPGFPTSTNIKLGDDDLVNKDGDIFTIYAHVGVEGYSAFGSMEGDGAADGPMVNVGMYPTSMLRKNIDATENWQFDSGALELTQGNMVGTYLSVNTDAATGGSENDMDWLANGWKMRRGGGQNNNSGDSHFHCVWGGTPIQGPAPASNTNQGRAK